MKQITEFTELELKAMAFDNVIARDNAINNLKIIQQELERRAKESQKVTNEE